MTRRIPEAGYAAMGKIWGYVVDRPRLFFSADLRDSRRFFILSANIRAIHRFDGAMICRPPSRNRAKKPAGVMILMPNGFYKSKFVNVRHAIASHGGGFCSFPPREFDRKSNLLKFRMRLVIVVPQAFDGIGRAKPKGLRGILHMAVAKYHVGAVVMFFIDAGIALRLQNIREDGV